jgi:lipopolysaccharide transport system ATP-binding protein
MSDIAIRVSHLGKRYRLGPRREMYATLRDTIASVAQTPVRVLRNHSLVTPRPDLWALRDVSFEVKHGEVLGIIGRNGAGKSTLLKVLSRVTRPTTGRAELNGRVGALLEVGTGFHSELSGRENIFLNGAILGMTTVEIKRSFDAIVAFAEIEPFLDMPVKRYSSGMQMRLAFSVAAHFEPDILIVDEVLAVGDAAFQKKCLGRIGNVRREGRTILFVSHNMPTLLALCDRAVLLNGGALIDEGATPRIVERYLAAQLANGSIALDQRQDRSGDGSVRLTSVRIENAADAGGAIRSGSRLRVVLGYSSPVPLRQPQFVVSILDQMDIGLFVLHNEMGGGLPDLLPPIGYVSALTEPINLTPGRCMVHLEVLKGNARADYVPYAASFEVEPDSASAGIPPREWAMCLLGHTWQFSQASQV